MEMKLINRIINEQKETIEVSFYSFQDVQLIKVGPHQSAFQ